MMNSIIEILEILSILYLLGAVYGKRFAFDIYSVVLIITELVLLTGINEYGYPQYLVSLSYILICIYSMLNYKALLKQAIVNCVIVFAIIGVVQTICYIPISFVYSGENSGNMYREFMISIVGFGIILLLAEKIKWKEISDFILKRNKWLAIISIFVCVLLGKQIWTIKKNGFVYGKDYIPVIYFVVLIFVMIYEWQKARNDAEIQKTQMEMNTLYYDAYKELIQSIREKQHDFKNHMNALSGMLYTDAAQDEIIERQKEYFNEILGEFEDVPSVTMVENPLLSGFLIKKISEAEVKGITIERQCVFTSQRLQIPEYKLVAMMGILCDNAMEAVPQEQKDKKIWIEMWKEDKLFCFSVKNCYDGERLSSKHFGMNYSSKGKERGLGLAKLQRLLDENGGTICMEHGKYDDYRTIRFIISVPI